MYIINCDASPMKMYQEPWFLFSLSISILKVWDLSRDSVSWITSLFQRKYSQHAYFHCWRTFPINSEIYSGCHQYFVHLQSYWIPTNVTPWMLISIRYKDSENCCIEVSPNETYHQNDRWQWFLPFQMHYTNQNLSAHL